MNPLLRLSRLVGKNRATAATATRRRRSHLQCESLEERALMNSRFVVPLEVPADGTSHFHSLATALTKPGLASGDVIQIEPGSVPGGIKDSDLPGVQNLTIRGNPAFSAHELPEISTRDTLSIGSAQKGLTLDNVHLTLSGGGLTFNANGTIISSHIVRAMDGIGIYANVTAGTVLRNNFIVAHGSGGDDLIKVVTLGNQNEITGNTLVDQTTSGVILLHYTGASASNDVVQGNTFVSEPVSGFAPPAQISVGKSVTNLTIQGNTFRTSTAVFGVYVQDAHNIAIRDNTFDLAAGFAVFMVGGEMMSTSAVIANNFIRTGAAGHGIQLTVGNNGVPFAARIEGNDFALNKVGVKITTLGDTVANIDLGGGSQGSVGANNFRSFTAAATSSKGAIVCAELPASTLVVVNAKKNLFSVANPKTVIWDSSDNAVPSMYPAVVTNNQVTGNAAYVQALYQQFLHRVGDVSPGGDASGWVNALDTGTPATDVVNAIARSTEALDFIVTGLYRRILNRDAGTAERQGWVDYLATGASVETVAAGFYASTEYSTRFGSDRSFVVSLYTNLLGRVPGQAEVDGHVANMLALGRAGLADIFLDSAEYRSREITRQYTDVLKRAAAPAASEVAGWVNSGLDLLSIAAAFAASAEFQTNG